MLLCYIIYRLSKIANNENPTVKYQLTVRFSCIKNVEIKDAIRIEAELLRAKTNTAGA